MKVLVIWGVLIDDQRNREFVEAFAASTGDPDLPPLLLEGENPGLPVAVCEEHGGRMVLDFYRVADLLRARAAGEDHAVLCPPCALIRSERWEELGVGFVFPRACQAEAALQVEAARELLRLVGEPEEGTGHGENKTLRREWPQVPPWGSRETPEA